MGGGAGVLPISWPMSPSELKAEGILVSACVRLLAHPWCSPSILSLEMRVRVGATWRRKTPRGNMQAEPRCLWGGAGLSFPSARSGAEGGGLKSSSVNEASQLCSVRREAARAPGRARLRLGWSPRTKRRRQTFNKRLRRVYQLPGAAPGAGCSRQGLQDTSSWQGPEHGQLEQMWVTGLGQGPGGRAGSC